MQGFRNFYYGNMKTNINNVLVLKKCGIKAGKNVTNPIIRFTFDRAMTHVLERSLLEIVSAYELVNKELIRHGIRRLGFANQDYKDLKIMRNKLLAHKIENSLKTERYKKWYSKKYGDYEKTFDLILRVSERIVKKIEYLELKEFIGEKLIWLNRLNEILIYIMVFQCFYEIFNIAFLDLWFNLRNDHMRIYKSFQF